MFVVHRTTCSVSRLILDGQLFQPSASTLLAELEESRRDSRARVVWLKDLPPWRVGRTIGAARTGTRRHLQSEIESIDARSTLVKKA